MGDIELMSFLFASVMTLLMLTLLQAVLGFDNLLYISIESKRVPEDKQAFVRKLGIGLAIGLRIALLFVVMTTITSFSHPLFSLKLGRVAAVAHTDQTHEEDAHEYAATEVDVAPRHSLIDGAFNIQSLITLMGGVFIIYTAVKEIFHMLAIHDIEGHNKPPSQSVGKAVAWIVIMNLVFSFDSILSAMALTENFYIMAAAIIVSGLGMIWLADRVADFLKKNRVYEILGLFVLFIVGIMLVSEGAHHAELHLFSYKIDAMQKSTFYFVLGVLVLVDVVQGRYQKKLLAEQAAGH